jgi:hypothetical protein
MLNAIQDFWRTKINFKTSKPTVMAPIKDLKVGQMLELEYKHPKDVGIINSDHLTTTRLNPDEIDNRKIQGVVINVFREENTRTWVLGIRVHKQQNNFMVQRDFLLMEYEIVNFRILS